MPQDELGVCWVGYGGCDEFAEGLQSVAEAPGREG